MNKTLINIITLPDLCPNRVSAMKEEMKKIENCLKWRFEEGVIGKNIEFSGAITRLESFKDIEKMTYSSANFTDSRFYDSRRRLGGSKKVGEIGATWSNINLYKKLLFDQEFEYYLILEDDTVLLDAEYLYHLLENLPLNFDIIHLATSIWNPLKKDERVDDNFYTIERDFFNCAAAYIVSRGGADKLLKFTYDTVFCPPDDLMSNAFLFTNNFRVLVPDRPVFAMGENNNISVVNNM